MAETLGTVGRSLISAVADQSGADHLLAAGNRPAGLVPAPRLGPILTTRDLADAAPGLDRLDLGLGDIELF